MVDILPKKIVAIDLFCGAGGLTRGLLDAGIDVVGGFDIAKDASYAYEYNNIRANGQRCKYFNQDVATVTASQINELISGRKGKHLLLAGCAPCQPFSSQNRNKSPFDDRKNLLLQFARLVQETSPDFVFMENVPGLPRLAPEVLNFFIEILRQKKLSFIDSGVVNAKWYGVPQNRRRFILLASKKKIQIPNPACVTDSQFHTVRDAIAHFPCLQAGEMDSSIPNHRCASLSPLNLRRISLIKHNRNELPEDLVLPCHKRANSHDDTYGRMSWDSPAPTLTTKFFSISNGRYGHPEQNRAISLREGASIQTFPANYVFSGSMQSVARQIGNAVPPLLAKNMSQAFITNGEMR